MNYWLLKTEPSAYSVDDLEKETTTLWSGIRNYQARNYMRDSMSIGDICFIYHSNCKEIGVVGSARVARTHIPDPTQFDPQSDYFDPKSTKENPPWICVEVSFEEEFPMTITLSMLKNHSYLKDMVVCQKGSRLSITPVLAKHAEVLQKLAVSCTF